MKENPKRDATGRKIYLTIRNFACAPNETITTLTKYMRKKLDESRKKNYQYRFESHGKIRYRPSCI